MTRRGGGSYYFPKARAKNGVLEHNSKTNLRKLQLSSSTPMNKHLFLTLVTFILIVLLTSAAQLLEGRPFHALACLLAAISLMSGLTWLDHKLSIRPE